jgi:hypothetical protein
MKIDPAERTPQLPQHSVDHTQKKQAPGGFEAVLQQTMQKTGPSRECMGTSIRGMTGPQSPMTVPTSPERAAEALAHKLLDTLEDYQKLLGDPDVTLKRIQPAVERMQNQAAGTCDLIAGLPETHPMRTILQDTVDGIDQEIARFNAGYYIDDQILF